MALKISNKRKPGMDGTGECILQMETERKPWTGWKSQISIPLIAEGEEGGVIRKTLTGQ